MPGRSRPSTASRNESGLAMVDVRPAFRFQPGLAHLPPDGCGSVLRQFGGVSTSGAPGTKAG